MVHKTTTFKSTAFKVVTFKAPHLLQQIVTSHLPPVLIDSRKASPFLGHLRHDVGRAEDGLEVEPSGLTLEPLVENVL